MNIFPQKEKFFGETFWSIFQKVKFSVGLLLFYNFFFDNKDLRRNLFHLLHRSLIVLLSMPQPTLKFPAFPRDFSSFFPNRHTHGEAPTMAPHHYYGDFYLSRGRSEGGGQSSIESLCRSIYPAAAAAAARQSHSRTGQKKEKSERRGKESRRKGAQGNGGDTSKVATHRKN